MYIHTCLYKLEIYVRTHLFVQVGVCMYVYTLVCTGWNMYVRTHLFVQVGICLYVHTCLYRLEYVCTYTLCIYCMTGCAYVTHVTAVYYQNYSHIKL